MHTNCHMHLLLAISISLLSKRVNSELEYCNTNDDFGCKDASTITSSIPDRNGGWGSLGSDMPDLSEGVCNIDIHYPSTLTKKEFLDRYSEKAPVILRGFTENKVFSTMCEKDKMIEKYGDKVVRLSTANTYSYEKFDVPLKDYIMKYMKPQTLDSLGNETYYWFGDNNHTEWKDLFSAYNAPTYNLPRMTGAYSFGVAAAGTGVPFHFHGPGFAEVIFGRKRWFLYPYEKEPNFNPDKSTLNWLVNDYPKLSDDHKPFECTIGPGEVIFFPHQWWHATLNLDASVFISTFLGYS